MSKTSETHPRTELFRPHISHSVHGGVCIQGGLHPAGLHPGVWADSPSSDTMEYSQWAGGTHPKGMHSCFAENITWSCWCWFKILSMVSNQLILALNTSEYLLAEERKFSSWRNLFMNICSWQTIPVEHQRQSVKILFVVDRGFVVTKLVVSGTQYAEISNRKSYLLQKKHKEHADSSYRLRHRICDVIRKNLIGHRHSFR